MQLELNPEQYVGHYEIVVDGGAAVSLTPAADGSATFDLSSCAPGGHTVTAVAVNASGSSAPASWTFMVPLPVPAEPTGQVA